MSFTVQSARPATPVNTPSEEIISPLGDHLLASAHTCFHPHTHSCHTQTLQEFEQRQHKLTGIMSLLHTHTHTLCHTSSPAAAVVFRRVCVIDFCVCVSPLNAAIYFPFSLAECLQLSARKPQAYGAATAGY